MVVAKITNCELQPPAKTDALLFLPDLSCVYLFFILSMAGQLQCFFSIQDAQVTAWFACTDVQNPPGGPMLLYCFFFFFSSCDLIF